MLDIQKTALQKALQTLRALNCQYAVIDPENTKYGDLEVNTAKKGKKKSIHPYGELAGYIGQHLHRINVGEVKEVPYGKYGGEAVQSSAAAWMNKNFGAGAHTSAQNHAKQVLEVLRLV